jgi:hypothetical protein
VSQRTSEKLRKSDLDWFKEIKPEAKSEFPPALNPKVGVVYHLTFKESCPRVVPDKFAKTAVIEIEVDGKARSLFLGHTYLAQKIYQLQKKHDSLMGLKISLKKLKKTKNYIEYDLEEI